MRFVRLFILALTVVILSCQKDGYHIAFLISGEGRTKKVEGFLQGLKALNIKISSYKVYNGKTTSLSLKERRGC
ncbi:hypothetical protein [Thermocrinis minervae]|uniref:hypothetical protein n=1 Tax=Thermocrinis minervae TaxID=381751 RepID=UPI001E2FB38E|nr:hypothetical protein [Thermocrinis minervae]